MADPVAEKSAFLCMYMSSHPDTLVAYAKWYGKVEEPISGAKMTAIDSKSITLQCTPKSKPNEQFQVVVPINPPLKGYDDIKPRLLEMKAIAQEGLGMIKAPKIRTYEFPITSGTVSAAIFVGLSALAYLVPDEATLENSGWTEGLKALGPFLLPFWKARELVGADKLATNFWSILVVHAFESLYTIHLCRKHSTGFLVGAQYALSTVAFGWPIWSNLRRRIQNERIDSVMKVE
ncbi:hypothetical protein CC1G_02715 [Coprinopsis cinerea okayama7|uniref:DUF2470 domain-containing protein n=1 Tax=Coprinopsis cinerea (strain Okayama-7 / 130 / ATCC MYA-4618 / FGSC 9003) TaxID=240176 RepID=A8PBR5_COPC7|nr:hypothetical protein CC1G_02715 [Coprinopsis cinerea okayama7\|eukprot:XP_001840252.1 hypothetical protein CC1G_02715 [Coprinopsis cinerea okayama7\